ncbi:MFS transporter [Kitasatospora sp. NPDC088783]|uniref:MFS transporter n=1 Tax=Kitasatospora sp. NPDC088783 TaxID=3364077 RepID=UPI003818D0FE
MAPHSESARPNRDTTPPVPADRAPGLRHNRNWQVLWTGQLVSQLGDFVFDVTVVLWVGTVISHGQRWAPIAVSGVLVAAAVPTVLIGPVAGVFVDRWNRRRTMLVADLVRAALVGSLLAVPVLGDRLPTWAQLAAIYTAVAATATVSQFFNPARFATVGAAVAPEDRPKAFSLASASANTASVLGPPLAAPLLFSVGVRWAIAVNMLSYLLSYALIRMTRIPESAAGSAPHSGGFRRELDEGLHHLRGNPVLRTITLTVFLYMFGVGAVNVLEVFFVSENLKADPSWLGTLNGALGLGSIAGALLSPRLAARIGERPVFAWGIVATALLVFAYARSTSLPLTVALLGVMGVPLAMVNTVLGPIILQETPNRLLGRINAVLNPLVYLASVASMALAGLLASRMAPGFTANLGGLHLHRIDLILSCSAGLMALAGATAVSRLRPVPPAPLHPPPQTADDRSRLSP